EEHLYTLIQERADHDLGSGHGVGFGFDGLMGGHGAGPGKSGHEKRPAKGLVQATVFGPDESQAVTGRLETTSIPRTSILSKSAGAVIACRRQGVKLGFRARNCPHWASGPRAVMRGQPSIRPLSQVDWRFT